MHCSFWVNNLVALLVTLNNQMLRHFQSSTTFSSSNFSNIILFHSLTVFREIEQQSSDRKVFVVSSGNDNFGFSFSSTREKNSWK